MTKRIVSVEAETVPAATDFTVRAGDEILLVNGVAVGVQQAKAPAIVRPEPKPDNEAAGASAVFRRKSDKGSKARNDMLKALKTHGPGKKVPVTKLTAVASPYLRNRARHQLESEGLVRSAGRGPCMTVELLAGAADQQAKRNGTSDAAHA